MELLSSRIVDRGKPTVVRGAANTCSDCLLAASRSAKTLRMLVCFLVYLLPYRTLLEFLGNVLGRDTVLPITNIFMRF